MKKLFALTLLVIAVSIANAQISSNVTLLSTAGASKTSVTNADTATAIITASDYFRSTTVVATKTSGTVAGTIYWYGSGNGTNYDLLDSLVVANTSGAQYKTFKPSLPLNYYKFKVYILSTNGVWTIAAKQLNRQK